MCYVLYLISPPVFRIDGRQRTVRLSGESASGRVTASVHVLRSQNTESPVSKSYIAALSNVLHHQVRPRNGSSVVRLIVVVYQVKMVYVASLNDQVVPIYSGLFTSASHPLILRALYIDGDAYQYV